MMKRMKIALLAVIVGFVGITARLAQLLGGGLREVCESQSSRTQVIATARGTIYDRYGKSLVNCTDHIVVCATSAQESADALKTVLSPDEMRAALEVFSQNGSVVTTLSTWLPPTVGIKQISAPLRYDGSMLACHTIGYIDGDGNGVVGIEKGYNEVLKAMSGDVTVTHRIDAIGRIVTDEEAMLTDTLDKSREGIALTLDAQIQQLVQEAALSYLDRGAVLITQAQSGEVLASVSAPVYDRNDVQAVLNDERSPLLDRTLINYNCGSVFKIVTAAAALERGFSSQTTYTCNGSVTVDGVKFKCHNTLGDGTLTMGKALAVSCNCYFIQLAMDVGADALCDTAQKLGFSSAITVADGVSTARSILPTRRDLSADAALANFSIGQGDLLTTPYHVDMLLRTVLNNGTAQTPYLYYGRVGETGEIQTEQTEQQSVAVLSRQTARVLIGMLKTVVTQGTGTRAAPLIGSAGGKTGTAETGWEMNGETMVQSWFSGFYPAEDPQYVITVLSENGGTTGKTAAPLFAEICDRLFSAGLVENAEDLY